VPAAAACLLVGFILEDDNRRPKQMVADLKLD
jgi:hypothetical protein